MITHHAIRYARKDVAETIEKLMSFDKDLYICGSWRRGLAEIGDLDVVAVGKVDPEELYHRTEAVDLVKMKRVHLYYKINNHRFEIEIMETTPDKLGAALLHFTGSAKYNHQLRSKARQKGWKLSENGLYEGSTLIASETEEEILDALCEKFITPEKRSFY
jgi:DNA polymerase/3'-5' exonuclease PolX